MCCYADNGHEDNGLYPHGSHTFSCTVFVPHWAQEVPTPGKGLSLILIPGTSQLLRTAGYWEKSGNRGGEGKEPKLNFQTLRLCLSRGESIVDTISTLSICHLSAPPCAFQVHHGLTLPEGQPELLGEMFPWKQPLCQWPDGRCKINIRIPLPFTWDSSDVFYMFYGFPEFPSRIESQLSTEESCLIVHCLLASTLSRLLYCWRSYSCLRLCFQGNPPYERGYLT